MSALAFGPFSLDAAAGQLRRGDAVVPLAPKAFAVLEHLLHRPGQLVTKDELLELAWSDVHVGDGALKVCIREIRRALGDDPRSPTYIETAHRRGYRFIAPVSLDTARPAAAARAAVLPGGGSTTVVAVPETHYARSGDVNIAYQVVGGGPIDLVFVMGWVSHLEYYWREPSFARFLERLARVSRLILFDKRGTGLSDPVREMPTLEQRMDDVRAVLDAVGSRRAVLLGVSEGGPMCSLFAATYPDRTEALVMIGTYARRTRAEDYPWGPTPEAREAFCDEILAQWGGPLGIEDRAPSMAGDPAFRQWWATYLRMGASPGAAVALTRMNADIDIRHILPTVRVPTLVLHRSGDRCLRVEEGRYVAAPASWSCLARTTCRLSVTRTPCLARSSGSWPRRAPGRMPRACWRRSCAWTRWPGPATRCRRWCRPRPPVTAAAMSRPSPRTCSRSSTARHAPSAAAARSAARPRPPASTCGSACIRGNATWPRGWLRAWWPPSALASPPWPVRVRCWSRARSWTWSPDRGCGSPTAAPTACTGASSGACLPRRWPATSRAGKRVTFFLPLRNLLHMIRPGGRCYRFAG